jgi:phage gp36-like protein
LRVFGVPLSYTAVTRINSAFPAINSITNINSAIICQYAEDVEAEIDAVISKLYALPLTVTCPILVAIATRETIYRIAVQRALIQFPPAQQGKAPLQVQHEDDQKLLQKIADGKIQLISSSGAVLVGDLTQMEVYSTTKNYVPTFHEGAWTDMNVDQNKLDDILADRS